MAPALRSAPLFALVVLLLALAAPARADQAYDKVAAAFAQAGGQLDPCAFAEADLKAAVRGIPPAFRNVVPALRAAMAEGIAAHERGDCRGVEPEEGTTGGARAGGAGSTPAATVPPVTTPPVTTQTAPAVPQVTAPPTTAAPAPAPAATQPAVGGTRERDRTPLLIALIAAGALVLLALLLWSLARTRGWDPGWAARMRHGWGEAGFRATTTWAEFTDWLRLGR